MPSKEHRRGKKYNVKTTIIQRTHMLATNTINAATHAQPREQATAAATQHGKKGRIRTIN